MVLFALPKGRNGSTGPVSAHEARPDGSVAWKLVVSLPGGSLRIYRATPMESLAGEVSAK